MYDFKRSQRVAQLLREEISKMITYDLKDPAMRMSTIATVRLSDDLKFAKIYVSVIGSAQEKDAAIQGLNRAKSWIRSELGRRLDLRHVPQIDFSQDDTVDYAQKIERLLKQIKK
ncbi:MAG: 30S ribosome-binding factor RbfA [bacterium]